MAWSSIFQDVARVMAPVRRSWLCDLREMHSPASESGQGLAGVEFLASGNGLDGADAVDGDASLLVVVALDDEDVDEDNDDNDDDDGNW